MRATLHVQKRSNRTLLARRVLGATGLLVVVAAPGEAQFNLGLTQRAVDGTVYQVIAVDNAPLLAGADEFRVTTVGGGTLGLQGCTSPAAVPGNPISALAGADPGSGQTLHSPFSAIVRTTILNPNNFTINFNPFGSGRLTIGTGGSAVDVCRQAGNCAGGATDATVVGLSTNDGVSGIPAACIANNVMSGCSGMGVRNAFAFGLSSSGNPPACTSPPTTDSTLCGARPSDGFTVRKGQVVVFIYNGSLGMSGFTIAAAGFGIDTDGVRIPACGLNTIVSADAQFPSAPPPAQPPQITINRAPTLAPWAILLVTMLLGAAGIRRLRRHAASAR